ncbi:MAG: DUF2892 domain-containing protein [Pirellulales bacterium]|nr:DUF2892 domain-containing protein [Pirellulales bacterium]
MASSIQETATRFGRQTLEGLAGQSGEQNVGTTERLASALIGGGLVLAGLMRGKWAGLVMGIGGGALVYRGLTGYCPAYNALGIRTNEPRCSLTEVPAQHGQKRELDEDLSRFSDPGLSTCFRDESQQRSKDGGVKP